MRQYRWNNLEAPGFELLEFEQIRSGVFARSMVIGTWGETPGAAIYRVRLDANWVFHALEIRSLDGAAMRLNSDGMGNWTDGSGAPMPLLAGCTDIDLSASPFSNTLPIRRASFVIGEPQRFRTARVDFATLEVTPHVQTYTRRNDTHFVYQSETTGYESELSVDTDGFVVTYPGLFQLV